MKNLDSSRHALSACAAVAILTACGGSQPPIGAPGAMPQTPAIATQAGRGKSWMLQEAASEDLIYAPGECGGTCVLSYPDLKQVGALGTGAAAICSDAQGNVFLSAQSTVTEYAHGGTVPIATLTLPHGEAWGCSVDPMTNNLAVVFKGTSVAVFSNESGSPVVYSTKLSASYCGYDNAGNLFVSGYNVQAHAISELPQGAEKFTILSVKGELGEPGQIQWDGTYMAYEGRTPVRIARLSISGSVVKVVGETLFAGTRRRVAEQSWIYQGNILLPYGKKVENLNKMAVWAYPQGGRAEETFKAPRAYGHSFGSVTVSVAPSR
jgi:hypothetical protein